MADLELIIVDTEQGTTYDLGSRITVKVASDAVKDAFCVLELVLQNGQGASLHVHHREDEIFSVLEGECVVGTKESQTAAARGITVVFPKETAHFFRNDSAGECRVSIVAVPGGLDRYFGEIAQAVAEERFDDIAEINRRYAIEFF
jgi:mannose-6-phosphate isomerase-like protein (cupin superfamily)